jgi:hypothetical protein
LHVTSSAWPQALYILEDGFHGQSPFLLSQELSMWLVR